MTIVNYSSLQVEDHNLVDRNVRDEFKHIPTEEIRELVKQDRLPFNVACLSVTGDLNVGSILRSAHLFGATETFVIGRRKLDRRGLVGMQNYMTIHRLESRNKDMVSIDPARVVKIFEEYKMRPIVLETTGVPLPSVEWNTIFDNTLATIPCLTLGNEGRGIDPEVMAALMEIPGAIQISIPQRGAGRSHNVANAAAIVMGHMVNQMGWWAA